MEQREKFQTQRCKLSPPIQAKAGQWYKMEFDPDTGQGMIFKVQRNGRIVGPAEATFQLIEEKCGNDENS